MARNFFIFLAIAIIVITGGYYLINKSPTGNIVSDNRDKTEITLSMKNYNYYPNTITVKKGIPVEITLDSSIRGCYRSFLIPSLGVSKRSSSPEDKITFTPQKTGTFRYQCGMGMGTGTIVVE